MSEGASGEGGALKKKKVRKEKSLKIARELLVREKKMWVRLGVHKRGGGKFVD